MRLHLNSTRWWRMLCALAVLLGMIAPQTAPTSVPTWLASAICHAPGSDAPTHGDDKAPAHSHCALCLGGQAVSLPPTVPALAVPRSIAVTYTPTRWGLWPGPGADHPYVSRAPPVRS
jgi:hypothetical protein